MAQVILTDDEVKVLIMLLEGNLGDLSVEIADTDQLEFRSQLKARRETLLNILNRLKASSKQVPYTVT